MNLEIENMLWKQTFMEIIESNVLIYSHSTGHDCHEYIDYLSTIISSFNDKFGSIPHSESITAEYDRNNHTNS